ncbi:hypothetical protein MHYP_G00091240 [Metynnis hypsauchen]
MPHRSTQGNSTTEPTSSSADKLRSLTVFKGFCVCSDLGGTDINDDGGQTRTTGSSRNITRHDHLETRHPGK